MRELEFLPDWYPRLRKRKSMVAVQTYATVILITGLCLWGWLSGRNIRSASASLNVVQVEINQADNELHRLDEELEKKKELDAKHQILDRLGRHVESVRVMAAVEAAMPDEMTLLNLTTEVKESARPMPGLAADRAAQAGKSLVDRRLNVTVRGVGPTDATLARFMRGLGDARLFDHINNGYAQERVDNNRVMREFSVTFDIDLNPPAGGGSGGVQ